MGLWQQAAGMAAKAPPERNRYVDFLRAFSILAVVVGHWLVAAPYLDAEGTVRGGHLLGLLPWTQWLTWGFQVMPLFFLVGGFSNAMSWSATRRKQGHYSDWFASRVQRLINPVFPVLLGWALFAFAATMAGMDRANVEMAVMLALVPVWFLAVYLLVTALVPLSFAAWERWGFASFAALVAGAVAIDLLTFVARVPWVNFLNFLFVWVGIHQLGYAWRDGRFERAGTALAWFAAGLAALIALVWFGPYPVAMIGVPGADVTNSMPPTLALLALGVMQSGLALALQGPARRMLERGWLWTATVLTNGMIMTVYLWHLTAFVLVMVGAWLLGGIGLDMAPGSAEWWWSRPVWFALYIALLLPLIAVFVRWERGYSVFGPTQPRERPVPELRLVIGLLLICLGLAMTAAISIASPMGASGVRWWVVALPFVGAALVGFGPVRAMLLRARGLR